ncbi:Tn3 family transposase [Escherichia coli]
MEVIEQHWDEVLRLKASIGAGLVPPSVILKKLAASPRQNRLNLALREMGRIERSIFICDWLLDTRLRRRSHAILNKGESRHALARAIFLHQLGEFRNRAAETMAHRASGLDGKVHLTPAQLSMHLEGINRKHPKRTERAGVRI